VYNSVPDGIIDFAEKINFMFITDVLTKINVVVNADAN
jgi:hypothetical protein